MSVKTSRRQIYLDVLRVLASFLICYNHAFGYHLFLEQEADGSLLSWINVATAAAATISMPLFFMLSGALLLGRQESYKELFSGRIWRFLVLLICASAATYCCVGERPLRFAAFVRDFLRGDIYMTYWFLYAYLSLLLAKPLLQKIAQLLTGKDILFLLAFRFVFFSCKMLLNGCASLMDLPPLVLSGEFQLPFTGIDILFYPLAGYYLSAKLPLEKIGRKEALGCFVVFLLGTGITSALVYAEGYYQGFTQNYTTLFSYSSAMAVFVLTRFGMSRCTVPNWLRQGIIHVSKVTIGIYLLEPIVCDPMFDTFHQGMPWTQWAVVGYSLAWCFVCITLCGGLTCLLRLIPGVKKYL